MMVIVVSNAPPRLRGRLAAWLVEIRAGVFVGDYSARTRNRNWDQGVSYIEEEDAVMVRKAPTDQGYDFFAIGRNRRMPVDFDGLKLVFVEQHAAYIHISSIIVLVTPNSGRPVVFQGEAEWIDLVVTAGAVRSLPMRRQSSPERLPP